MDLNRLMMQAQNMQKEVEKTQAEIESAEFEVTSAQELVYVKVNGKKVLQALTISEMGFETFKDDKELLEDMILATVNDALSKAEDAMSEGMGKASAGMKLPNGMKMPF